MKARTIRKLRKKISSFDEYIITETSSLFGSFTNIETEIKYGTKILADNNGGEIEALGTICMKTSDNKILTGWLASQTDMLTEDWIVVE
jgi:hypothetical protein